MVIKVRKRFIPSFGIMLSLAGILSLSFWLCSVVTANQQMKQYSLPDDLFSITFPTENDGWACGRWGTVLHTSDGGKTWVRQKTGTDYTLSSIFFTDPKQGWAVGDEGTIIHTADGGKTWQKQKSPVPFFLMGSHFINVQKGWIVTERTHILYTENGGKTWKVQFSADDFILKAVSFADALNGWAVGEYGLIYHTKDGGKIWGKEAGFFGISEKTGKVESGKILFSVVAIDPKTAWAVGIDGYVTKTVDSGKTWTKVNTPAPQTQLFCIASSKTGTICIGGKRAFLVSTDGGNTWKVPEFKPPITYGWIYGITRRGDSSFATVGQQGKIYVSDGNQASAFWHMVGYKNGKI